MQIHSIEEIEKMFREMGLDPSEFTSPILELLEIIQGEQNKEDEFIIQTTSSTSVIEESDNAELA